MVTTRSADKRNNTTQDELVLRSKVAETPSKKSSIPTASSRKRTTNASSSPRSKRARLDPASAQNDVQDNVTDSKSAVIRPTEETPTNEEVTSQSSDGTITQQNPSDLPSHPVSTPEQAIAGSSPQAGLQNDKASRTGPSSQSNLQFFTPKATAHKRFNSQEPEADVLGTERSGNQTGTDSSAHQEYQTAEEEIVDSDEAPDVETTKIPSSNPTRGAGRATRARRTKKSTKKEDGTEELTASRPTELHPATDTADAPVESNPAVANTLGDEASSSLINDPTELSSQGVATDDAPLTAVSTTETSELPPHTTMNLDDQSTLIASRIQTDTSIIPINPTDAFLGSSPTRSLTSLENNSSHLSLAKLQPTASSSLSLSNKTQFATSSNSPLLPRKSQTTLSSYRRALIERRAQRSSGAFRLEPSWTKKRRAFAV